MTRDIVTYYEPHDGRYRSYFTDDEPDDDGQMTLLGIGDTEKESVEDLMDALEFHEREKTP
jgi:hypothetical protein